jgi:D-alanine-D-alanine ligase-like ATP-grasp enzyme
MYTIYMSSLYTLPASLRIGVLRGGPSPKYDISLANGNSVLQHLSETHRPTDIFVSKDGVWHMHGMAKSPENILKHIDVVINTVHSELPVYRKMIHVLNAHATPYVGSNPLAEGTARNVHLVKERARLLGLRTPTSLTIRRGDSILEKVGEIFHSIPYPLVVKPGNDTSLLHFYVVRTRSDLLSALENVLYAYPSAIVEEYISGNSASCVVTDNFRDTSIYSFPPRGELSKAEQAELEYIAKKIHYDLGLTHFSQADFVVSPRRGVYLLHIETVPDFREESTLRESLDAVGVSIKDFLHHLIGLALNRK